MMRRFLPVLCLLVAALSPLRATTIAGSVTDLTGLPMTRATFVRFELKGCGTNTPRIIGQNTFAASTRDFVPDAAGHLNAQLVGNDALTCGTASGTYYHVSVWNANAQIFFRDYIVAGVSWNINTAAELTNPTDILNAAKIGDLNIAVANGALGTLRGNASTVRKFLGMSGNGTLPTLWDYYQITVNDLPDNIPANKITGLSGGGGGSSNWGGIGGTIANQPDLVAALSLKADQSATTTALNSKVSTTDFTNGLATKANAADLTAGLALKANTTDMTAALALKAKATDLVAGLALKANVTDLDGLVSTSDFNSALSGKANSADVASGLALKANLTDLTGKADTSAMTTALAAKADTTAMTTALSAKADTSAMNTALGLKADTTALAGKVDTTALTTALAGKADTADLAAKANVTDMTTALASKADASALAAKANTSDLSTKADTTALTTGLAGKVDTTKIGALSGVAPLDGAGLVPTANLPTIPGNKIGAGDLSNAKLTNLANTTGDIQAQLNSLGTFTQSTSPTVRQVSDELSITVTPQQFGALANGVHDDSGAFVKAINYLASLPSTYTKRLKAVGNYYFTTANYQISLPYDNGDYANSATGSGATVGLTITEGAVSACSVSGGTAYMPSSVLQVRIWDQTHLGSGAHATVATDASGVPTSCTVTQPGINYPATGVSTAVQPLGADGATGTATLTGGVITAASLTTGGTGGYTSAIGANVVGLTGCTVWPTFTTTVNGSGVATGVAVANGGSGCKFNTLSDGANLVLAFGDSCGGAQCTNLPPETPQYLNCAVALRSGIEYDGNEATVSTPWVTNGRPVNTSQLVPFCDPWGDQASGLNVHGFNVTAMVDFWFAGNVPFAKFDGLTLNGGVGMYLPMANIKGAAQNYSNGATKITNTAVNANGGVVCGGQWTKRNGKYQNSGGSLGGWEEHGPAGSAFNFNDGGSCSGLTVDNMNVPIYSGLGVNAALDTFFETYVWKTQNGPSTLRTYPNGQTQCYVTNTVVNRATDFYFNTTNFSGVYYPFVSCYTGVTGSLVVGNNRLATTNFNASFSNMAFQGVPKRPIISGAWGGSSFQNISNSNATGALWADPYLASGASEPGFIELTTSVDTLGNTFANIYEATSAPYARPLSNSANGNVTTSDTTSTWMNVISGGGIGNVRNKMPCATYGSATNTTQSSLYNYICPDAVGMKYYGSTHATGAATHVFYSLGAGYTLFSIFDSKKIQAGSGTIIDDGVGNAQWAGNVSQTGVGGNIKPLGSGITATLPTAAIAAGACSANTAVTVTGAATTMVPVVSPNSDATAVTGYGAGGLRILPYVNAANTVSIKVCNPTAASITPGALTVNVRVIQ
jgi:hypothetical protein